MTKVFFSVKIACILCCAALWSVNSNAQNYRTGYGEWYKKYIRDDFGDPIYDRPYIASNLINNSNGCDISFYKSKNNTCAFCIHIFHNGGVYRLDRKTATIKIKSANGVVSTITAPIDDEMGQMIILVGDNAIRFAKLINPGNYSLVIYVRTAWSSGSEGVSKFTFRCSNETKDFYKAAKAALGYSFPTY